MHILSIPGVGLGVRFVPLDVEAKLVISATSEAKALISPFVTSKLNVAITRPFGAKTAEPRLPVTVPGVGLKEASGIGLEDPPSTTQRFGLEARDVPAGSWIDHSTSWAFEFPGGCNRAKKVKMRKCSKKPRR